MLRSLVSGSFKTKVTCSLLMLLCVRGEAGMLRYLTGNRSDVSPSLSGPAHCFGGGGDVEPGIQWMINQVRGCENCDVKLDVVVLRSTGADAWNESIYQMKGVDSVETLVVHDRNDANRKEVEETVRNAEVVFYAGGDQCNYVRFFKGTRIETATESVYKKKGGIGGSSAGFAIMSDFVYDACTGSTKSQEALLDPYHHSISFTYDFFLWDNMKDTFADQHVVARDRLGRTLAFVARQIQDKKANKVWGVGVNEDTSLAVDRNGMAAVIGTGPVYFILADHIPEVCERGKPLTFSNFKIWKVETGGKFNLKDKPASGYYVRSVLNGHYDADPYNLSAEQVKKEGQDQAD